jgi:hypothetical protein
MGGHADLNSRLDSAPAMLQGGELASKPINRGCKKLDDGRPGDSGVRDVHGSGRSSD